MVKRNPPDHEFEIKKNHINILFRMEKFRNIKSVYEQTRVLLSENQHRIIFNYTLRKTSNGKYNFQQHLTEKQSEYIFGCFFYYRCLDITLGYCTRY